MQNMTQYIKTYILYIYKSIKKEVTIMGNYGITGWSGGGRRPITNNLRAGQFRQMGVPRNVSSNIFINNNFGCAGSYNSSYFDGCCGYNDGGMSKFEKWMMGLGISGGLLGGILGAFGKGKSEGAGDTGETKTDEFAGLKELYKNEKYTFSKVGSDYCCNTGDDIITAPTIEELNKKLMKLKNKPTQAPATTAPAQQTTQATATPAETNDEFLGNYNGLKNKPVEVKGTDLAQLFKNVSGVYDDGKDPKGREIGDFTTAKAKNYDAQKGTVKIGNHEYKVISNQSNGYLYVEDTSPRGGSKNRQVYIIELNSDTNKYELHQRPFDENCIGVGKGAH